MPPIRRSRRWFVALASLMLACWLALGLSWVLPCAGSVDRWGIGLVRGFVVVGKGSGPIGMHVASPAYLAQWPWWTFGTQTNGPRLLIGPSASWRPSVADGVMMISAGPAAAATTYSLRVHFIPLWWAGVLLGGLALLLWRRLRRLSHPGCCPTCRYDLRGLAGGTCPECGARVDSGVVSTHDEATHALH